MAGRVGYLFKTLGTDVPNGKESSTRSDSRSSWRSLERGIPEEIELGETRDVDRDRRGSRSMCRALRLWYEHLWSGSGEGIRRMRLARLPPLSRTGDSIAAAQRTRQQTLIGFA